VTHKTRIAVLTNIIPEYRKDFYERLFANKALDLTLFCQEAIPGMNVRSVHRELTGSVVELRSIGLKGEKLVWQRLPIKRLIDDFDVIFLYGNPRVISNVVWSGLLRLLGKKVVVWGQLHTAGANPILEKIRLGWWGMFSYVFLYTDAEAKKLRNYRKGRGCVIGMNNGLNYDAINDARQQWSKEKLDAWRRDNALENKRLVLSCARLIEKNKFELMLNLLPEIIKEKPEIIWCVVGDGDKKQELMNLAVALGVEKHVRWKGAIYNEEELAPLFLSAEFLVHPGAIGLSLMHAFGYGLPVITHNNEADQMPEFAALEDGVTGFLIEQDSPVSLKEKILGVLVDSELREQASIKALNTVREGYNTKVMADRFMQMVECVQGK
jgi:glycosyltransferase involved in cell wall biosynthesis